MISKGLKRNESFKSVQENSPYADSSTDNMKSPHVDTFWHLLELFGTFWHFSGISCTFCTFSNIFEIFCFFWDFLALLWYFLALFGAYGQFSDKLWDHIIVLNNDHLLNLLLHILHYKKNMLLEFWYLVKKKKCYEEEEKYVFFKWREL